MHAKASGVTSVLVQDQIPTDEMMAGGHLSVRRMADVALDTPGYNGHTTVRQFNGCVVVVVVVVDPFCVVSHMQTQVAELLWVGVPTVTLPGLDTMAARLATSLITAAGAAHMSVPTFKSYEDEVAALGGA